MFKYKGFIYALFALISVNCSAGKEGIEGKWVADNDKFIFLHEDSRFEASFSDNCDWYLYGNWSIEDDTILILKGQLTHNDTYDKFSLNRIGRGMGYDMRSGTYDVFVFKGYDDENLLLGRYENTGNEFVKEYQHHDTYEDYPLKFTREPMKPADDNLKYWTEKRNRWRSQSKNFPEQQDMTVAEKCRDALNFAIVYLEYYKYQDTNALLCAINLPLLATKDGYFYEGYHTNFYNWEQIFDSERDAETGEWYFKWMCKQQELAELTNKEEEIIDKLLVSLNYYAEKLDEAEAEHNRLIDLYEADTTKIPFWIDSDFSLFDKENPERMDLTNVEIKERIAERIKLEIKEWKRKRQMLYFPSYITYFRYVPLKVKDGVLQIVDEEDWIKTNSSNPFRKFNRQGIANAMFNEAFSKVTVGLKADYEHIEDLYIDVLKQIMVYLV